MTKQQQLRNMFWKALAFKFHYFPISSTPRCCEISVRRSYRKPCVKWKSKSKPWIAVFTRNYCDWDRPRAVWQRKRDLSVVSWTQRWPRAITFIHPCWDTKHNNITAWREISNRNIAKKHTSWLRIKMNANNDNVMVIIESSRKLVLL